MVFYPLLLVLLADNPWTCQEKPLASGYRWICNTEARECSVLVRSTGVVDILAIGKDSNGQRLSQRVTITDQTDLLKRDALDRSAENQKDDELLSQVCWPMLVLLPDGVKP